MATSTINTTDHYVTPAQLCVGLYVHLDLSWSEHPFAFSSFKIKNADQVATIRSLGLTRIRYSPERSQVKPLPDSGTAAAQAPEAPRALAQAPAATHHASTSLDVQNKRTGADRQAAHRARVAECERALLQNARIAKSIAQNLRRQPGVVAHEAQQLVQSMSDSMLLDVDIAIHLMADRIGTERVYHHALNVSLLSMMLAREMKLPADSLRTVGLGALFHDAGLSPGPTGSQPHHTVVSCDLVTPLALPSDVLTVISQHHEQMDGKGEPRRLKPAQISPAARVVAVVDQFDALCNPDEQDQALSPHEALSLMYGPQRTRYDERVLMTFVRCMGIYPPGTIVTLSNGMTATVVAVSSSRPLKPTVRVHDVAVPAKHAEVLELEQHPNVSITGTLRPRDLQPALRERMALGQRMTYQFSTEPAQH